MRSLDLRWRMGAAMVLACLSMTTIVAAEPAKHHALSLIGKPKLGADFKHFDWVNPNAPKGGVARISARGTFDTFFQYNIKGNKAAGLGLIYDKLMFSSPDEASTEYGLIAETVSYPADFSAVTFNLRPSARFHDGKPVTVEDVIFSLEAVKKHDPMYAQYYKNVVKSEKTGPHQVTFTFDVKGNRELPQILGQMTVLPKHYWDGKDANGEPRDPGKTTLEAPLGSGPYKIKEFQAGRSIVYERVKDWWAKDLPVGRGMHNFDTLRFEYFRDRTASFEAFKSGNLDFFQENSAKEWATAYDLDSIKAGHMKKEQILDGDPPQMQAFILNQRRKQMQDPRVRRALNLAFDFEWANKNLFYDQYARVQNFFGEADLKSQGLPAGKELALLDELRKDLPPEVFTTEYKQPLNKTPEDHRRNMSEAVKLLTEAGWTPKNGVMTNAKGETLTLELLTYDSSFERVYQPYVGTLKKLGINASIRIVDIPQYQRRTDDFDYDIIGATLAQSSSPGNEQREYWGSAAADIKGSRNLLGLKNPVFDKLIDKVIFATDREELAAATRALDRVLLWNQAVVPQWFSPYDRIAYWDKFARPAKLPSRSPGFPLVWWWDDAASQKLAAARGQ